MDEHYIGIDVSKASLEVYIPKGEISSTFENSRKGIKQFYAKLKKMYRQKSQSLIFIYEHTGSYSTLLDRVCSEKETACYRVRPTMSANFAKVMGNRNKTDKADAKMLYQMYSTLQGKGKPSVPLINQAARNFKALMSYYKHIQKERVRIQNYLDSAQCKQLDSVFTKRLEKRINALKKEEAELLEEIQAVIADNPDYSRHIKHFTTIKGIGEIAAIALLNLFLSYPETNRREITALIGLDPTIRESGTSIKSKSRISKQGNKLYRSILFMPAMMATLHNEEMRNFAQRLRDRGKQTTQIQLAVMRKLVLLAHALYVNNQAYDPEKYKQKLA